LSGLEELNQTAPRFMNQKLFEISASIGVPRNFSTGGQ